MKNSKLFLHYQALAKLQNCVLESKRQKYESCTIAAYTLYSNTTFTEGEFLSLNEVKDALDNDPSFK